MFGFCLEEQAEQTDIAIAVSETSINKKYFDALYLCMNLFIDEDKCNSLSVFISSFKEHPYHPTPQSPLTTI